MGKDLNGKELGTGFSQRPDGRYEARATVKGVKIDIYNTSLTKLKKEFEIAKEEIINKVAPASKQNYMTLKDWYKSWFENYKSKTIKGEYNQKVYNRKIENTFIKEIGYKNISDVTQMDIQIATNVLLQSYNERTVREALGVLRECFTGAIANDIVRTNPCQQIIIADKGEAQKERRVLEQWEQDLLLEEVEHSYYKEAYTFLLLTGVRIGEFSGLQWQDIDWENKLINIRRSMSTGYLDGVKTEVLTTPKTSNSYRVIPFFGETEAVLKSWMEKQQLYKKKLGNRWRAKPEHGDLIWTSTMGSPITRYVISHDIKKVESNMVLKELMRAQMEGRQPRCIEHIHPHCFRHTFATRCFEKGMNPLVVQAIMGHANYSTTVSYTHVLNEKRKDEVLKVGNFL